MNCILSRNALLRKPLFSSLREALLLKKYQNILFLKMVLPNRL